MANSDSIIPSKLRKLIEDQPPLDWLSSVMESMEVTYILNEPTPIENAIADAKKSNGRKRRSDRYRKKHPEITRLRSANSGAKVRGVDSKLPRSSDLIADLMDEQCGLCGYCGIRLHGHYQIEHVLPLTRGGSNDIDNLLLTCPRCNTSKRDRTFSEWKAVRGW